MDHGQLIELAEKYSFIYDRKHVNFKNKLMKENAWRTIATMLDSTAEEVEQRWLVLKNRYNTEKRKVTVAHFGMAEDGTHLWPLFEAMRFLDKFIIPRKTYGNVSRESQNVSRLSGEWDSINQIVLSQQVEDLTLEQQSKESETRTPDETSSSCSSSVTSLETCSLQSFSTSSTTASTPELQRRPSSAPIGSNSMKSFSSATSRKRSKRDVNEDISNAMEGTVNLFKETVKTINLDEEDDDEFFGRTVGKSLKHIKDSKMKARARIEILEVLEKIES